MPEANAYPLLFSPLQVGRWRLKNRIVHASMSLRYGAAQGMHPSYHQYYLNRARGGAALIITDPVAFLPSQGSERLCAWNDSMVDDLSRFSQAIRSEDCHLLAQIQDNGRARRVPGRVAGLRGASALPDDLFYAMPEEMTPPELEAFVEAAAEAALRLQRCGYTGVELSAGHGHLFHQFLSPRTNLRQDDYGATLAGRSRLLVEVCQAIRQLCGDDFMLAVKLPGDDGLRDGVTPSLAAQIARHLVDQVPVNLLSYAQGTHHHTLEMHLPDDSYPRQPYMPLIRRLKLETPEVPVMRKWWPWAGPWSPTRPGRSSHNAAWRAAFATACPAIHAGAPSSRACPWRVTTTLAWRIPTSSTPTCQPPHRPNGSRWSGRVLRGWKRR